MTFLTLLATILPGFLICYFIVKLDKHEKEPLPLLAICLGLGASIFFAARYFEGALDDMIMPYVNENNLNPNTHFGVLFFSAFIRTAFVEEFLKLIILLLIPYNHKAFNEPMDGIVYAVMIGMGFAIVENVIYCMSPPDIALAIVRNLTAVPSHAVFAVILGYYIGLAKFDKAKQIKYILLGFFLTVFIHGLYDIFLFQEYENWLMVLATFVLLGGLFFSQKFISRHQNDSPFNDNNKEAASDDLILDKKSHDDTIALEQKNKPSQLKEEENEILSAVLFEMKGQKKENLDEEE